MKDLQNVPPDQYHNAKFSWVRWWEGMPPGARVHLKKKPIEFLLCTLAKRTICYA